MPVRGQGKDRVHQGLAMTEVATGVVVPAERSGQRKRAGILARAKAVIQRGA
jgi:hypothetical protein